MRTLTIALCLLAAPALADVAGVPTVIDGDTIEPLFPQQRTSRDLGWTSAFDPKRSQMSYDPSVQILAHGEHIVRSYTRKLVMG